MRWPRPPVAASLTWAAVTRCSSIGCSIFRSSESPCSISPKRLWVQARSRLGERAGRVEWIVADVTEIQDVGTFDVWHDRAVFHFLTDAADRRKYVDLARRTLPEGGHLIIASFADDGPKRCSDLDVCRYNAESMAAELGEGFSLIKEARETHATPWDTSQAFFYGVFRRL